MRGAALVEEGDAFGADLSGQVAGDRGQRFDAVVGPFEFGQEGLRRVLGLDLEHRLLHIPIEQFGIIHQQIDRPISGHRHARGRVSASFDPGEGIERRQGDREQARELGGLEKIPQGIGLRAVAREIGLAMDSGGEDLLFQLIKAFRRHGSADHLFRDALQFVGALDDHLLGCTKYTFPRPGRIIA